MVFELHDGEIWWAWTVWVVWIWARQIRGEVALVGEYKCIFGRELRIRKLELEGIVI